MYIYKYTFDLATFGSIKNMHNFKDCNLNIVALFPQNQFISPQENKLRERCHNLIAVRDSM